jgi:hypothetical protein
MVFVFESSNWELRVMIIDRLMGILQVSKGELSVE